MAKSCTGFGLPVTKSTPGPQQKLHIVQTLMYDSLTNFETTRNCIGRIKNRRYNAKSARTEASRKRSQKGRRSRRSSSKTQGLLRSNVRHRKTSSPTAVAHYQNDRVSSTITTMNQAEFDRFVREFHDIKPYRTTHAFGTETTMVVQASGYDEFGPYLEIYGEEAVNTLSVESTASATPTAPGDVVYMVPSNPMYLPGTRPYIESKNNDRYKLMHSSLHYVPQVPVTQNGSIIITPTPDDADSFVSDGARQSILRSTGYAGAKMINVVDPTAVQLTHLGEMHQDPLYTQGGSYGRDESEGYYVITASTFFDDDSPTITLGWLLVKYHIRFYNPVTPVVAANFIDEIRIINDIWGNVFSAQAINKDDPICGIYAFWLPQDETQGFYAAILLEDFLDSAGNVIQAYTETRNQFALKKGQLIYFYVADDKLADCINFAISPSDAIAKENPLRFAVTPTIVGANVLCNLRVVFFPTSQEL
mgnify:FL=1